MPNRTRRKFIRMSVTIAIILAAAVLLILGCQRSIIYPRHFVSAPAKPDLPTDAQRLTRSIDAGTVEAFFLPGDGVSAAEPGPLVAFWHGNGETIDRNVEWAQSYQRLGVSVLLIEYRGYGRSDGSPSQQKLTDDAVHFVKQAAARDEVDADRIIHHGRSLGTGVACAAAEHRKPAAFILESAFTSVKAVAASMWIPPFLVLDPYDNQRVLSDYSGPVLLLHGRRDEVIAYRHAEKLHETTPHSRLVTFETTHNTMTFRGEDTEKYWDEIETFLREHDLIEQPTR